MWKYLEPLHRQVRPSIRDDNELHAFIRRVTAICIMAALVLDAVNNIFFFHDWQTFSQSLSITLGVALVIAYPVIRIMATAHLALYRAKKEMEELSRRDPLTGLGNRRAMIDEIDATGEEPLLVAIADIDRFKDINDKYGHVTGDLVIARTAKAMADELGDLGLVCRTGGEEFALIARKTDTDAVRRRLISFCRRLSALPIRIADTEVFVTVSIGAAAGRSGQPFSDLYALADRSLYAAKSSGRNMIVMNGEFDQPLHAPQMADEVARRRDTALAERRVNAA